MTGTRDLAEIAYVLWALASAACARLPATETNAAPTSQAVTSAVAATSTPNPPTLSPVDFVTSWTLQGSLEPFLAAPRLIPGSWSPDSRYLSFWTWTAAEVEVDYLLPAGTLHFFDAVARRACESPVKVGYPYFGGTLVWQHPGVAWMATSDERVVSLQPCSVKDPAYLDFSTPVTALQAPPQPALVHREKDGSLRPLEGPVDSDNIVLVGAGSTYLLETVDGRVTEVGGEILLGPYSPDGRRLAVSESLSEGSFTVLTRIVEVATAEELAAVSWEQQTALGGGVYVSWLNNEELFIGDHVIGEPLILRVDGEVVTVASDLFGRDCSGVVCLLGSGRMAGSGDYNLLLEDPQEEFYPRPWLIYHSETGTAEELPASGGYAFSPDGRTLASILPKEADLGTGLWWRALDGGGPLPRFFKFSAVDVSYGWSPDSSKIAFRFDGGFGVVSIGFPAEAMLWATGAYEAGSFIWSPDSSHLAVPAHKVGVGIAGPDDGGLFIVNVRSRDH